jgi:arginase family enzyme
MFKRTPHFFKARSRIGITNRPVRQVERNYGVEQAPDQILTEEFLKSFPGFRVSEFNFPYPEDIEPKNYLDELSESLTEFKDQINSSLKAGETQVVIGGDNCVTFSSLWVDLLKYDVKVVGYIQFDSHGEMNSLAGSPSKNFHGMYMRPFFGEFDIPEIEQLVPFKLAPTQAYFLGDLLLDGDEPEFYEKLNFKTINRGQYYKNKSKVQKEFQDFIQGFKHLHLNFDMDIFDQSVAPAYGCLGDGKWLIPEIMDLINILSKHPSITFDLCEVNPKKRGAAKTIKVAHQLLKTLLN